MESSSFFSARKEDATVIALAIETDAEIVLSDDAIFTTYMDKI